MFSLDNFEADVSETILSRGLSYFQNHAVESLEESSKGEWIAVVSGSEAYEVEVRLKSKEVIDWQCDCPYDGGPICKHVVAVLFALREVAPAHAKKRKGKARKMSFEDILSKLDIEELRAFIRFQKDQKREFGKQFMLFFSDKDPHMDVEKKYQDLIRQVIKQHTDRGFMDYRGTFAFSKAMMLVFQAADHAVSKKNFREAMAIAKVVCLEVIAVMAYADDSAANVSTTLMDGIQIFQDIARSQAVGPEVLDEIFSWLEKHLMEEIWFDYGDFRSEFLDVAASIASRVDAERFLRLLDKIQASKSSTDTFSKYYQEDIKKRKISFLQAIGREKEAEQLISASMDIVEVRLKVVEKALEQKDFSRANQLVHEGIELAVQKDHPGTVRRWEEVLLKIAQEENDLDTFRFYTKKFALGRAFNLNFYQGWKSSFSLEEWPEVIEQHIQSVIAEEKAKPRKQAWDKLDHSLFQRLADIYVEEQLWERLLKLIPEHPSENILMMVHRYLAKRYPTEMLAFYLVLLEKISDRASTRGAYQHLAALMKKIKQDIPGSHSVIDELAASLIQKYARRPAMKEELRKVLRGG